MHCKHCIIISKQNIVLNPNAVAKTNTFAIDFYLIFHFLERNVIFFLFHKSKISMVVVSLIETGKSISFMGCGHFLELKKRERFRGSANLIHCHLYSCLYKKAMLITK